MISQSSILNSARPRLHLFLFLVFLTGTALTSIGCSSSKRQLVRYDFRGAVLAIDAPIAPPPSIITNTDDDLWGLTEGTVGSVFRAATAVVKESNADKARKRLRKANEQVDVSRIVAEVLHENTERYLYMHPAESFEEADFVMAICINKHGLFTGPSFDGRMAFFLDASVELFDPRAHRVVWKKNVNVEEPMAYHALLSNLRSAKTLSELDEAQMIEALERLSEYSGDAIMRALNHDLARAHR